MNANLEYCTQQNNVTMCCSYRRNKNLTLYNQAVILHDHQTRFLEKSGLKTGIIKMRNYKKKTNAVLTTETQNKSKKIMGKNK